MFRNTFSREKIVEMEKGWRTAWSKKEKAYYYWNESTHETLWKVECPEDWWAKRLIKGSDSSASWIYINLKTGRELHSKSEFTDYINSLSGNHISNPYLELLTTEP